MPKLMKHRIPYGRFSWEEGYAFEGHRVHQLEMSSGLFVISGVCWAGRLHLSQISSSQDDSQAQQAEACSFSASLHQLPLRRNQAFFQDKFRGLGKRYSSSETAV